MAFKAANKILDTPRLHHNDTHASLYYNCKTMSGASLPTTVVYIAI